MGRIGQKIRAGWNRFRKWIGGAWGRRQQIMQKVDQTIDTARKVGGIIGGKVGSAIQQGADYAHRGAEYAHQGIRKGEQIESAIKQGMKK